MTAVTSPGSDAPNPQAAHFRQEITTPASRYSTGIGLIVLAAFVGAPAFVGRGLLQDLFFIFTMLALAQYWNLLAGYAGLVSVGQQAYVGLGGYSLFALVIGAGIDPLIGIPIAGVGAGLLAAAIGPLIFRLHGAYFAIGTWVVAEICRLLLAQVRILGGGTGTSLPPDALRSMIGVQWIASVFDVRASAGRDMLLYWLALLLLMASFAAAYWLLRSRQGLALSAIRDSEIAASSVGVDVRRTKMLIHILTAAGTGMTGALLYIQTARISPDAAFSVVDWTAYVIFIVVIGGIGTLEGPIVGILILYLLREYLSGFGSVYLMILGFLAIATMLFAPRGLWGTLADRFQVSLFPVRRRLIIAPPAQLADEERR
jgi:branched-chain amino acid transport system permease protein